MQSLDLRHESRNIIVYSDNLLRGIILRDCGSSLSSLKGCSDISHSSSVSCVLFILSFLVSLSLLVSLKLILSSLCISSKLLNSSICISHELSVGILICDSCASLERLLRCLLSSINLCLCASDSLSHGSLDRLVIFSHPLLSNLKSILYSLDRCIVSSVLVCISLLSGSLVISLLLQLGSLSDESITISLSLSYRSLQCLKVGSSSAVVLGSLCRILDSCECLLESDLLVSKSCLDILRVLCHSCESGRILALLKSLDCCVCRSISLHVWVGDFDRNIIKVIWLC